MAPIPEVRGFPKRADTIVPQGEGRRSLDVRGIMMRQHNYFLVGGVEALYEVDLILVGERAVHKQRTAIVISRVQTDYNPLVVLDCKVTGTVLERKGRRLQSLAKVALRAAIHLMI